jgi:hypothetical protein
VRDLRRCCFLAYDAESSRTELLRRPRILHRHSASRTSHVIIAALVLVSLIIGASVSLTEVIGMREGTTA